MSADPGVSEAAKSRDITSAGVNPRRFWIDGLT